MRLLTFDYNRAYLPSAPFIEIEINGYDVQLGTITYPAFVDSGSDGTMIPRRILRQIGAEYEDTQLLSGTAGGRKLVEHFSVGIRIGEEWIGGIAAVATTGDEIIIGRDVLNYFEVRLNGPATMTEVVIY